MHGFELSARYRPLPYLQAQLSWSSLEPGDFTAFNPSQQLKYIVTAALGAFHATVAGQYVHDLFAGDKGTLPMSDYHVLDVILSWESPWHIEAYVKGRNILNRAYNVLPNYAAPGAHVLAGFRYALEG